MTKLSREYRTLTPEAMDRVEQTITLTMGSLPDWEVDPARSLLAHGYIVFDTNMGRVVLQFNEHGQLIDQRTDDRVVIDRLNEEL